MRWNNQDIPDQAILTYIENSPRMLTKIRRLLASLNGQKSAGNMTATQRSARARKAVQAREARRHKNNGDGQQNQNTTP